MTATCRSRCPASWGTRAPARCSRSGRDVTGVREGQDVVLGWPYCGRCRNCLAGEPRYCLDLGELVGAGQRPGGRGSALRTPDGGPLGSHFFGPSSFATYAMASASSLVPVPEGLPVELMGPLACGLATGAGAVFNTLRPEPGSSIVVSAPARWGWPR